MLGSTSSTTTPPLVVGDGVLHVHKPLALLSASRVAGLYEDVAGRPLRTSEVYRALREGKIKGYKMERGWNWFCLYSELPEQWPDSGRKHRKKRKNR